jgi:hypothetical protein
VDEGRLCRNPARSIERPTTVEAIALNEHSDQQCFVFKMMVKQHTTPRFVAIFDSVGEWLFRVVEGIS